MSQAPVLSPAPDKYDRSVWQQILKALLQMLNGVFRAGQDVRLVQGERFSLKSDGGTEVFFTVDDAGNLLTPTVGVWRVVVSSAGTLTLSAPGFHVFTGTTATWTMPTVADHSGWFVQIKNRGSGDLTVQRAAADQLYSSTAVNSITVLAGASVWLCNDGTYWDVERFRSPYG